MNNTERNAIKRKEWRRNNRDKVLAQKKRYRDKHKDELKERAKEYSSSYEVKLQNTITRSARACFEVGTLTSDEIHNLLIGQGGLCNSCGIEISHELNNINLDHYIPTSLGGKNAIENVQWLCGDCNKKKGANAPTEQLTFFINKDNA